MRNVATYSSGSALVNWFVKRNQIRRRENVDVCGTRMVYDRDALESAIIVDMVGGAVEERQINKYIKRTNASRSWNVEQKEKGIDCLIFIMVQTK